MRKRRSNGIWMPTIGIDNGDSETPRFSVSRRVVLAVPNVETVVYVSSVIFDVPQETNNDDVPGFLGAFTQNAYFLQRVVGKINVAMDDAAASTTYPARPDQTPKANLVAAGLFVARAGDRADSQSEGSPVGGTAAWQTDYNPLDPNCIREPWLWRRTWVLGSPTWKLYQEKTALVNNLASRGIYPTTNSGGAGSLDGPHVDARTRRRVSSDDRLWVAFAAHSLPFGAGLDDGGNVYIDWEFRVFGSMRKDRNRGNF